MDPKTLNDVPPWEWPEGVGEAFLGIRRDDQADESDRLLTAELPTEDEGEEESEDECF